MVELIAIFTEDGVGQTGLTPTISVWEDDGTNVVNESNMTEITAGFYKYDFSSHDATKNYVIRADGGSTLYGVERYKYSTNTAEKIKSDTENNLKINKNKLVISDANKDMTIFDDDGSTELYEFDLQDKDGSPSSINVYKRIPK